MVEDFVIGQPKTKELHARLSALGLTNVLIVTDDVSESLWLSSRNLHQVDVSDVEGIDPVRLIGFDKILMTVPAVRKLEEALA